VTSFHDRFSDCDARTGEKVHLAAVLNHPTSSAELTIDQHPCALFGRQPLFAVGFGHLDVTLRGNPVSAEVPSDEQHSTLLLG
jgi:hypothetical protein